MKNQEEVFEIEPCRNECALCFINYTDVLIRNPMFAGLDKRTVGTLIRNSHHQVKQLKANDVYASEGDTLNNFIVIVQGTIKGEMMDYDGNMLTLEKRTAPQSIATAFLFGKKNKLPVTITAIEETTLLLIPKEELLAMFSHSKSIMKNFLDSISNRAQFLGDRIKLLSIKDLKGKVAYYLMEQMKINGSATFRLPHSQQELAEMFGSTRPSIGRIIRELHSEKLIEAHGKECRVLNQHAMARLIH